MRSAAAFSVRSRGAAVERLGRSASLASLCLAVLLAGCPSASPRRPAGNANQPSNDNAPTANTNGDLNDNHNANGNVNSGPIANVNGGSNSNAPPAGNTSDNPPTNENGNTDANTNSGNASCDLSNGNMSAGLSSLAIAGCPSFVVPYEELTLTALFEEPPCGEVQFTWTLVQGHATLSSNSGQSILLTDTLPGTVEVFLEASLAVDGNVVGTGQASCTFAVFFVDPPSFTLNCDNLTGTDGNDSFEAPLVFNPLICGGQVATFQTCDRVNGGDGTDVLNAIMNGVNVTPAEVSSVEVQNYTLFAATTLDAVNISGVDSINSVNSEATLTVVGLQELTEFRLINVTNAAAGVAATFAQAGTTVGTMDALELTLEGSNAGTFALTTAGSNGFEVLHIDSIGGAANSLAGFVQTTGTTLATCNITGARDLMLLSMPATIRTYDASAFSANLTLTLTGDALLTSSVVTLGSGDDTITYADADDNAPGTNPSADVINTGAGSDIITPGEGNDIVTPGAGNDTIVYTSNFAAAPVNNDGADQISGFAVGDRLRFDAAPPALTTMAFNTAIAQMTNINNDGANTVVVVDIDTDAGDTVGLFITLTGVTLTSANFMISGNDIVRMN